MDTFRTLLATCFFLVGCYFAISIVVSDFSLAVLFSAVFVFIAAHLTLPNDYRRRENGWEALEWVYLIIDFPYWITVFVGRFIARISINLFD
ncbi:hypothetical protein L4C36_22495 [Photobacterium japonica]|uniref:hypothetical protein n=1 Tax=Photobacterium japonica TaxID=2910235 RepID=UPI003D0BA7E3